MSSVTCLSPVRQNAQTNTDDYQDIISSLPNSLLTHILSFLPIRDSVLTSILSSKWRPLWTLVPVLDLNQVGLVERCSEEKSEKFKFVDIVSRIMALRNAISNPIPPTTQIVHLLVLQITIVIHSMSTHGSVPPISVICESLISTYLLLLINLWSCPVLSTFLPH